MNTLDMIEQTIYDAGISLIDIRSDDIACLCMRICGTENILIDRQKISTLQEQRVALTHELNHIRKRKYRTFSCSYNSFARYEREVHDETVDALFSFDDFSKALRNCQGRAWEMAEALDVTEDVVFDAIALYKRKGYIREPKRQG